MNIEIMIHRPSQAVNRAVVCRDIFPYNTVQMNTGNNSNSTTLYDAGGWFLIAIFFGGGIVGVILDYFWNYFIFTMALRRLDLIIAWSRKIIFCLIVTALGLLIDWLYFELAWGTLSAGPVRVAAAFPSPGTSPVLEISTIVIPIILITSVNFLVSRLLLKVDNIQGLIIGGTMGVLTAPWLIIVFVVINW